MEQSYLDFLKQKLGELSHQNLYKHEQIITSPQENIIHLIDHNQILNFCSNNYLGLANHPKIIKAAKESLDRYGFGLASVRFICGTQTVHIELEKKISDFLKTEATILYSSCFDANGGLFETLLGPEDAVISDMLNHASIIDGIRLCKAKRFRYKNNDMDDLEKQLKEAKNCRFRMIATDGVFSMDGIIANLKTICQLADQYQALIMVDDCHATGLLGNNGCGTQEYADVMNRIDIMTGTLGKALGGASGGYVSGKKEIIDWLRQCSRPYLFSNTLCPNIAAASLKGFEILEEEGLTLRQKLWKNVNYFRKKMDCLGFKLVGKDHPIIPILLGDTGLTQIFAKKMLEQGIYVVGFCYPVVPQQMARVRVQISATHTTKDLDRAIQAFEIVGQELNILK
ncbi:MAG: glycine C-acetyltransferase [Chlamydiales bacterium]